jgi:hypothetical protein
MVQGPLSGGLRAVDWGCKALGNMVDEITASLTGLRSPS